MRVPTRAVATAVLAAVMAVAGLVAAGAGRADGSADWLGYALAGLVAVSVLVFAWGWPVLVGLPSPLGSSFVVAVGGVGAVAAVTWLTDGPYLRDLPMVLALAVLLAFVNELMRRDGRAGLLESVAGTITGSMIAVSAAGWVTSSRTLDGEALVVTAALALAVSSAVAALPLGEWWGVGATVVAGLAAGALAGAVLPVVGVAAGMLLGFAVGLLTATLHVLFDRLPALERVPAALAAVVLPVAATGILVHGIGRVLAGG